MQNINDTNRCNFNEGKFNVCKRWVAQQLRNGCAWEDIMKLCVPEGELDDKLSYCINEELWPEDMTLAMWHNFVKYYRSINVDISPAGIPDGKCENNFSAQTTRSSTWSCYKDYLTKKMDEFSVKNIESSCQWILNHLSNNTSGHGTQKGLVFGSVQSGKTANMTGLASMAADYDWNFFIVLSGSIDNLRKQTQDRFHADLQNSEGIVWKLIDFTAEDKTLNEDTLRLNRLGGDKVFHERYITVCLKNKQRLTKLINWLYEDPNVSRLLRIVIIDDEADQASINTAEMTDEDVQERCAINQLIVNLANGKKSDGNTPAVALQAINYISFTATPYANVLNESFEESLYPKDFICALPQAHDYFGVETFFGNNEKDGFDVIRTIPDEEKRQLQEVHNGRWRIIPKSLKDAIAWFLCASAVLRIRGHKKSISMLVHTSSVQNHHENIRIGIENWLSAKQSVLEQCEDIYSTEAVAVTIDDLKEAKPDYTKLGEIIEDMPAFEEIAGEITHLLNDVSNIKLIQDPDDTEKNKIATYSKGLNICVDNCRNSRPYEDGTYLRVVYPSKEELKKIDKAPVFIVIGGNTLSRGFTLEGLVCSYFARNVNQADTLMQMARCFGFRRGYELLQRIWMTAIAQKKYEILEKIERDLVKEIKSFMETGRTPREFGPKIRAIPEIAKFIITAKRKSQMAVPVEFDFSGDSHEITDFEYGDALLHNLNLTEALIVQINKQYSHWTSKVTSAEVWTNIPFDSIIRPYVDAYSISQYSSFSRSKEYFMQWMLKMKEENKYLNWNVAVINGDNKEALWSIAPNIAVGKVERTRKKKFEHINIGSLRSGIDVLSDVDVDKLEDDEKQELLKVKKEKKDLIANRSKFHLKDTPLLLIYRIKKDGGRPSKTREVINSVCDIIGFSIIISGYGIGGDHIKALRVKMKDERGV